MKNSPPVLYLADRIVVSDYSSFVMGIVNCTPDSFSNERIMGPKDWINSALEQIKNGAEILDLGAESTRPGSTYVSEEVELERLIPVLKEIRKVSNIPVSIDTRKYAVMKKCFENGADILNDISAFEDHPKLAELVKETQMPVILMHKKGNPDKMQDAPLDCVKNGDSFKVVNKYLLQRAKFALKMGIKKEKIIIDPGIGFGKTVEANIDLLRNLHRLGNKKYSVLLGLSRKSFLGAITGRDVHQREIATVCGDLIGVQKGASFIRVHDVKAAVDSLKILDSLADLSHRKKDKKLLLESLKC